MKNPPRNYQGYFSMFLARLLSILFHLWSTFFVVFIWCGVVLDYGRGGWDKENQPGFKKEDGEFPEDRSCFKLVLKKKEPSRRWSSNNVTAGCVLLCSQWPAEGLSSVETQQCVVLLCSDHVTVHICAVKSQSRPATSAQEVNLTALTAGEAVMGNI